MSVTKKHEGPRFHARRLRRMSASRSSTTLTILAQYCIYSTANTFRTGDVLPYTSVPAERRGPKLSPNAQQHRERGAPKLKKKKKKRTHTYTHSNDSCISGPTCQLFVPFSLHGAQWLQFPTLTATLLGVCRTRERSPLCNHLTTRGQQSMLSYRIIVSDVTLPPVFITQVRGNRNIDVLCTPVIDFFLSVS